jgi:hypothetical protein
MVMALKMADERMTLPPLEPVVVEAAGGWTMGSTVAVALGTEAAGSNGSVLSVTGFSLSPLSP